MIQGCRRLGALLAISLLQMAPALSADDVDDYLAFRKQLWPLPVESDTDRRARIERSYNKFQSGIERSSIANLHMLLRAATQASLYDQTERESRQALTFLRSLESKGQASDRDYLFVYNALVHHRMFKQAREMFKDHYVEGMESLPQNVKLADASKTGRSEYGVGLATEELILRRSTLPQNGILVIAHPTCHFSVNAVRAIERDPALRTLFRDHAKWLAPAGEKFDLVQFQKWNKAYPDAPLSIAYRERDWPEVNDWGTPTFYFFHDGKLIHRMDGWGKIEEFEKAVRAQGLIDSSLDLSSPAVVADAVSAQVSKEAKPNQHAIDLAASPIRSKEDLESYIQKTPKSDSPFRHLSPLDQTIFFAETTFDDKGLDLFPPDVFQGLTATQAYEILALFGWQFIVPDIPGLRVDNPPPTPSGAM
jgi:hypothetical protein